MMKRGVSKGKKYFLFILYGLLLTIVLLYYRFPSEAMRAHLEVTAERKFPGIVLSIGEVAPLFPPGVKFVNTEFSRTNEPNADLFRAESLSIRPELWSMFGDEPRFCFDCGAYSGDMAGCVRVLNKDEKASFATSIDMNNIMLDEYAYLSTLIGRRLQGVLTGNITFDGPYGAPEQGEGEADLKIVNGKVELLQPILSFDSINFNELLIKLALKKREIDLTQVELKGPEINGSLSGTVKLRKDIRESRLYVRGTLEPFSDFSDSGKGGSDTARLLRQGLDRGKISIVIRGTLAKPRIKFI